LGVVPYPVSFGWWPHGSGYIAYSLVGVGDDFDGADACEGFPALLSGDLKIVEGHFQAGVQFWPTGQLTCNCRDDGHLVPPQVASVPGLTGACQALDHDRGPMVSEPDLQIFLDCDPNAGFCLRSPPYNAKDYCGVVMGRDHPWAIKGPQPTEPVLLEAGAAVRVGEFKSWIHPLVSSVWPELFTAQPAAARRR
jgi:hypothetical protein